MNLLFSYGANNLGGKQKKTENFSNRTTSPIYPNCKEAEDTDSCLQNSIGKLILKEAENQNLFLRQDTLKIGIKINVDGTTSVLDNETNNSELRIISQAVLSSLPIIEPAFSKK